MVQPAMPSWANAPAASVASLACLNSSAPGWGSVSNFSVNFPSNVSISQFLVRSSSVDDTVMTDTLLLKPELTGAPPKQEPGANSEKYSI